LSSKVKEKQPWIARALIGVPLVLMGMLFTAYYAYWNSGNQFALLSPIYNGFMKLFNRADNQSVEEWGVGASPPGVIYEDKVIFYFLLSTCIIAFVTIAWAAYCYKNKEIKNSVAFNISINLVIIFYGIKLLTNNALVL